MKLHGVLLIICFFCAATSLQSQIHKVLAGYSASGTVVHYRDRDITVQAARFETPSACILKSVSITLGGMNTGSARLRVFGHEGGASIPLLEQDVTTPVLLQKTLAGPQTLTIEFPQTISFSNNQFFIAVDQLSEGVVLLSDTVSNSPSCNSDRGEQYRPQCIKNTSGIWRYGPSSYLISADISYEETAPIFHCDTVATGVGAQKGISCVDINSDGFYDILTGNRLFLNDGTGVFTDRGRELGIESTSSVSFVLDMNNDGRIDILFPALHGIDESRSVLYLQNSDGQFIAYSIDLPRLDNPTCYSIADINFDGYPDVFIGQASVFDALSLRNYLLLNTGQLSFTIHSAFQQQDIPASSYGSMFVDINGDGGDELFIAGGPGRDDELWKNDGQGNFFSINRKQSRGISATRGCHSTYSRNDTTPIYLLPQSIGLPWKLSDDEILAPRFSASVMMKDADDVYQAQAVEYEEKQSGGVWGDINNDGLPDCILTTSCRCRYADVYIGQNNGQLVNETAALGLDYIGAANDAVWADVDNNGALDLLVVCEGKLRVYRQDASLYNHVALDLRSPAGLAATIGAKATVYSNGETFTRSVQWGRGLLMTDPLRLHYGLGSNQTIDSIVVEWPGSEPETFASPTINSSVTLVQGQGLRKNDTGIISLITTYPNPFDRMLTMACTIETRGILHVSIFSVAGTKIADLHNAAVEPGSFFLQWDGRDASGNRVASGQYIYQFSINGIVRTGKVTIVE